MPGVHTRCKPLSASVTSVSDEALQLERYLQRELEDDIARIFDESLYSDLEVVCGKLKILTHSCILKARTNQFHQKLQTILHVNIERDTFDEIYSFVSDIYTECNIEHQENEIISYLQNRIYQKTHKPLPNAKEDTEESEVFLTPKCLSPFSDITSQKTISSSPSTELTREYYALVPIEATDTTLLDQELLEQEVLSNAFHSILKYQTEDLQSSNSKRIKPSSLSLSSSHISKTVKHSNTCGVLNKNKSTNEFLNKDNKNNASQHLDSNHVCFSKNSSNDKLKNHKDLESTDKLLESSYSPDSLVEDDLSSSSDYLSAAYAFSPGKSNTVFPSQLNVGNSFSNMENIFPSSDSGLENTGLLESLGSHKDVTLDVSLTESTVQDIISDEANNSNDSSSSPLREINYDKTNQACSSDTPCEKPQTGSLINKLNTYKDCIGTRTSKDEKQRHNEEIITLESSSLSSETGSWESVFPPKLTEKKLSQKFINSERQHFNEVNLKSKNESNLNYNEELCPSLVQKSPFKSTSCFIDAASLVDGEDETIKVYPESNEVLKSTTNAILPAPSEPVPFSSVKPDISPNEWSQSNDNEDSLEQTDKPDPDSIQKDLSPTMFDMTPITEDSLCTNAFENAEVKKDTDLECEASQKPDLIVNKLECHTSTVIVSNTPNNSIMSLRASVLKQYESEESESDVTIVGRDGVVINKLMKYNESSPIISGGASIEDHLPQMGSFTSSPVIRRKIDNMPIVSGAYIPEIKENNQRKPIKPISASAWVVDMCSSGSSTMSEGAKSVSSDVKRKEDRVYENLRAESNNSKSRSSVDSDSSERSSHKFYIDLSSLPDSSPPKKNNESEANEKKNIFSMYIDLGEKSSLKNMPARLSSSLNAKKESIDCKGSPKIIADLKDKKSIVPDTPDIKVFEKYETLCNNPDISITEIIKFPKEDLKKFKVEPIVSVNENKTEIDKTSRSSVFDRSCQRSTPQVIQEESSHEQSGDLFVKLSDLDKTSLPKADEDVKVLDVRMTRSIPDNNWGDSNHSAHSRPVEVISSFHSENALSLNRLFPHLKNEFSRSMPGSLSSRTRSPFRLGVGSSRGDLDEPVSDVSEISSVQSSTCRSVVENSTTEESSQMSGFIGNCQSRLGQDLLRMFLEEIAPDVIVEVSGRRIKAHKCILSSRCQYFAGILSGGWVESAGNVIVLPPFSFNVVHFALCHIYSGVSTIPDSISIVELATIADMLGLEGLKEAIMFTLKSKYCHHFHKPCPVCTAGVLECFPLSSVYGLDDLYRKCLRWITKHFTKVWPTKAFATLPKELLDKCYQQHIINLTVENFVETVYGCGITVASLQSSRWSEGVARMCRRLVNAAAHFAAPRLETVLKMVVPVAPDTPPQAKQALDDCLAAAIVWAPPDETCRAYAFLSTLLRDSRNRQPKPDLITRGKQNDLAHTHAGSWRLQCEGALVRLSPRVVATRAFKDLPPDLRGRLRELGCIMFDSHEFPVSNPPVVDSRSRSYHGKADSKHTSTTRCLDIDHVRASFVPYTPKPAAILPRKMETLNSNNDLRDKKSRNIPPVIRTTKAQQERAKFNLTKNNSSQDALNGKVAGAGVRRGNKPTKSRYLEPKTFQEEKKMPPKKLVPRMLSSSESSRNSSPIQSRNLRTSRVKTRQGYEAKPPQTLSHDSLATTSRPRTAEQSTDSLTESQTSNKYATYTKVKHTVKGSFESIKSSKGQTSSSTVTSKAANNKMKTKIPVYVNQPSRTHMKNKQINSTGADKRSNGSNGIASSVAAGTKQFERKVPGSLMNATKASSAKMVPKILKDAQASKASKTKGVIKQNINKRDCPPEIPIMERSGTFLKDEPTFGEITTKFDIDK